MRLPNLDLTLLAVHSFLCASEGAAARDPAAARPGYPTRSFPIGTAGERSPFAPLSTARPDALRDVLAEVTARAAHAGLLDAPRAVRRRRAATDGPTRATPAPTTPQAGPATPTLPAPWADLWPTLTVSQRADLARAAARAQRTGVPFEDILGAVQRENNALTQRWLSQPIADAAREAEAAFAPQARDARRAADVDIDRMLRMRTAPGLAGTLRAAARLASHVHPQTLTADQETAYQTGRLADLFAGDRLCDPARGDLALLRAVHAGLRACFPDYRAPLLDEHAIAVASRLRQRCDHHDDDATARRARFFRIEVAAEQAAQAFAARLIPRRAAPMANAGPWFDGIAVRDAVGKNATDLAAELIRFEPSLAQELAMQAKPACGAVVPTKPWSALSVATGRCHRLFETWTRKRLNDLLESARFPFGTPAQSIDTILLRLAPAHGVRAHAGDDFATIMRDFNRLCAAWRAAPAYWISPTLAAALHFAHATGNREALLAASAPERENLLIDFFHESLAAYSDDARNGTAARSREEYAAPASSQRVTARRIVESLLVLPRWPMHVGKTLARGQPREILSLLPFAVPAYDIEEGIRHGNETRALRGAFQFGADLLMTWLGGRVDAALALPDALPFADDGERAMLGMLHRGLETLGEPHAVSLPLIERGAAEPAGATMLVADADVPLRYRPLASRARDGEIVPVQLPNTPRARLVHLPGEDRIVPVGLSGDVVWELNWNGHVVAPMSGSRLEELTPRALAGLRQPVAAAGDDAAPIADGPTMTAMTHWLDSCAPASLPRGATSNSYAETVLNRLTAVDSEDGEEWSIYQELGMAHTLSETFRLLTHRPAPRPDNRPLRFEIRPGATPAYRPAEHVITLPPAGELAEIEYLGTTGAVHFDPRDVWIHEFVHAMTLLTDPPPSQAGRHRGPVVYLTDRILYEINRPAPERITYAMPVAHTRASGATDLAPITERLVRENLMLDAQLAHRTPISPGTLVCGTEVAQRATVLAAKRIEAVLRAATGETPSAPFIDRLVARLHESTFVIDGRSSAHLRLLRHFAEHARFIYDGNPWARRFLDAWMERDTTVRWTLHRLSRILAERVGAPCRVDVGAHRLELSLAQSFAYLSPTGLKPYTMQRRVATLLAEVGLPPRARMRNIDLDTERGAVVYVEDKLLGLSRQSEDRRISARIWRVEPGQPPSAPPLSNPTLARRAADDEDRFLASVCVPQSDHTCTCS